MVKEFLRIKEAFADEKRTQILDKPAEIGKESLIQDEEMLVILTKQGYVKRTPSKAYRTQRHGGRGSMGLDIRDSDVPVEILSTSSLSTLLVFTSFGRVFKLKAYEIPETERTSRGRPIVNFIQKDPDETIAALLSVGPEERCGEAILATAKGLIKRAELEKVIPATRMPVRAITLLEGDKLVRAIRAEEGLEVLGITALGQALKFPMDELRAQGRASRGVRGLKLRLGDTLAHLERASQEASLLFVCSAKGYGKKTDTADVPSHHRGSGGVRLFPVTAKTGIVTGVSQVLETDTVVLLTDKGRLIRFKLERIPKISRSARGVRLMDLDPDESIIAMTRIEEA
jgi:DNA gyrase subunit A